MRPAAGLAPVSAESDLVDADVENGRVAVGRISSRKSRSFLRRERSETASTSFIPAKVPGAAANRLAAIRVRPACSRIIVTPTGPYRLGLMTRRRCLARRALAGRDDAPPPGSGPTGVVVVRSRRPRKASHGHASCSRSTTTRRSSTGGSRVTRSSAQPRGRSSATGRSGSRPSPTAALRAMCGQLIESSRAAAIERVDPAAAAASAVATRDALCRLSPAELRRHGLATRRAARRSSGCVRSLDLERLRDHDTDVVLQRLSRERGIGPWSVGVIALEGLGRYDHGLVGDLGLVKLLSALRGASGRGPRRRRSSSRRTANGRASPDSC